MRSSKYPLEAVVRLREQQVDLAAGELGRSTRALEGAQRTRAAAERAVEKHRESAAGLRGAEHEALARGELRAIDLATGEAWGLRVASEERTLIGLSDAARDKENQAEVSDREAKARLATRKVDADGVHKHRARFDEAQRKSAEVRDEEASFEAWRPKR
jgi:hypothetical protein